MVCTSNEFARQFGSKDCICATDISYVAGTFESGFFYNYKIVETYLTCPSALIDASYFKGEKHNSTFSNLQSSLEGNVAEMSTKCAMFAVRPQKHAISFLYLLDSRNESFRLKKAEVLVLQRPGV